MTGPDRDEALEVARGFTTALTDVRAELERLNVFGKRSRHLIRLLAVSLAADLILSAFVIGGWLALSHDAGRLDRVTAQLSQNRATIGQLHAASVSACRAGNQSRALEIGLWDHLAAISKPPRHATAAQKARDQKAIAKLLAYIRKTFAPRNCKAAYRLRDGSTR